MPALSPTMTLLLHPFAPLFTKHRSSRGSCCMGRWKRPSRKCAAISAWRPSADDRRWRWVSTPALLGLFALVTLLAHSHLTDTARDVRPAAWCHKRAPTFADVLARVRQEICAAQAFCLSDSDAEIGTSAAHPRGTLDRYPLLRHLIGESPA